MSIDEALDQYLVVGNQVFGHPRIWHERSILFCPRAKFASRKMKAAIVQVILNKLRQTCPNATPHMAREESLEMRNDLNRV